MLFRWSLRISSCGKEETVSLILLERHGLFVLRLWERVWETPKDAAERPSQYRSTENGRAILILGNLISKFLSVAVWAFSRKRVLMDAVCAKWLSQFYHNIFCFLKIEAFWKRCAEKCTSFFLPLDIRTDVWYNNHREHLFIATERLFHVRVTHLKEKKTWSFSFGFIALTTWGAFFFSMRPFISFAQSNNA